MFDALDLSFIVHVTDGECKLQYFHQRNAYYLSKLPKFRCLFICMYFLIHVFIQIVPNTIIQIVSIYCMSVCFESME